MKNNDLFATFTNQLAKLVIGDSIIKIALSGGLDSVVLLHLFSRVENHNVIAHHVHHGLSYKADKWALFCTSLGDSLNIPVTVTKVCLDKKNRTSLEALAREKRYSALKNDFAKNSYLVTAHHQDDQLETVLLALKRGAGLTGLQGIVAKQKLEIGYLIRPLLNFSREMLEAYANEFQLDWIEDESNQDQAFDRNFIRHSIAPLLKERWPSIGKTVARSALHCQNQQRLIDEIAITDLQACSITNKKLNIEKLQQLTETRRKNLLRCWFKQSGLLYPSTKQLTTIWTEIVLAQDNATPQIPLQNMLVCRYKGVLYLVEQSTLLLKSQKIYWQGEKELSVCAGKLTLRFDVKSELLTLAHQVEVCFRAQLPTNLMCQPIGRNKNRSIKKLLHEYEVPPWLRDNIPFVFINGNLIEAVGLWRCKAPLSETLYVSIV